MKVHRDGFRPRVFVRWEETEVCLRPGKLAYALATLQVREDLKEES